MMKPIIAVSGKNGQLGWEVENISMNFPQFEFIFCDRSSLDITNTAQVTEFFKNNQPAFFINTAAYTAVDKAETEKEFSYQVNAVAVAFLAEICKEYDTTFISFSTDYVFNGNGNKPYDEGDKTDPVNYYGYTKQEGEKLALSIWKKSIIIRTSWVYSSHGNNFVKTMLRLMKERADLNVVNDQFGSPTYAKDLAEAVMQIISSEKTEYGIYHFSNAGIISWFDFACAIKTMAGMECNVHPIPTSEFPTPAKRPHYSALSKEKIASTYHIQMKDWKQSLQQCMLEIKKAAQ
jgi:dTDP-4-dehydrorhamnose reductase